MRTKTDSRNRGCSPPEDRHEHDSLGGTMLPSVLSYEAVGACLRQRREARNLSHEELAAALALALKGKEAPSAHPCYLGGLEEGFLAPHPEHLPAMEQVLRTVHGELHHAYGYLAANETPPLGEEFVTLTEASRILGISKGSVHYAITHGKLEARRLVPPPGRSSLILLVRRADLANYKPRNYPRSQQPHR